MKMNVANVFHISLAGILGLCLAGVAACHRTDGGEANTIEVLHSWTSGGEAQAVAVLADAFDRAGGHWRHLSVAGFQNAGALVLNRMAGGTPPGAVQFIAGVQTADLAAHGLLLDLDGIASRDHWRDQLPPDVMDAISYHGHVYQVPVDLVVNNRLYVSRVALVQIGLDRVPADWPGFFAMLDRFRAKGIIPLALGGQAWQEQLLFDSVLLSRGGRDLFLSIYRQRDAAAARSPAFRDVAETFARLRGYTDAGSPGRNWDDATALVIQGRAGALIMGDWAAAEFTQAGQVEGRDFLCALGPIDKGAIVSSDVFAFPRSARIAPDWQRRLASVISQPAVQRAFSAKHGSLPAFGPHQGTASSACDHAAVAAIATPGRSVPYYTSMVPPDVGGDVNDVVADFWSGNDPSVDHFIDRFARTLETAT